MNRPPTLEAIEVTLAVTGFTLRVYLPFTFHILKHVKYIGLLLASTNMRNATWMNS